MIKCLLLIFGSRPGRTDLESNIFPSGPPTQTISTYYLRVFVLVEYTACNKV